MDHEKGILAMNGGPEYRAERTLARLRFAGRHMLNLDSLLASSYPEPAPYRCMDGVAIIEVSGPLMADSWWYQSYRSLVVAVEKAAADPAVKGVLLVINSPGGETDWAFEAATRIEAAGKAKPIWAVAEVAAYSAAYLIAACAERIYVSPDTGGVGSIGVYTMHWDYSAMLKSEGIKVTMIGDPEGKTGGNPYEPLSDASRDWITQEIERLSGKFAEFVARRRGMSVDDVRALDAQCKLAEDAVATKLADRLGTADQAWRDMVAMLNQTSLSASAPAAANPTERKPAMADKLLKKAGAAAAAEEEEKDQDMVEDKEEIDASDDTEDEQMEEDEKSPACEEEDKPESKGKGKAKAAVATMRPKAANLETVLALCAVAGMTSKQAQQLHAKGMSLTDVQAHIQEMRVGVDRQQPTISRTGIPAQGKSLAQIDRQAAEYARMNKGVTKAQAYVDILDKDPSLYDQYLAQNPAQTVGR